MPIRFATPADAPAIHDIYAHYAANTAITFAAESPTAEDFAARAEDSRYPFLVAEEGGRVAGFAYASPYHPKAAYRWDVELTVYLTPGCEGRGLGSALMAELLRILAAQGFLNAYSCITLPNAASLALHGRFGFRELGIFPLAGYKLGRWHDVIWLCKQLIPAADMPGEPRRVDEV